MNRIPKEHLSPQAIEYYLKYHNIHYKHLPISCRCDKCQSYKLDLIYRQNPEMNYHMRYNPHLTYSHQTGDHYDYDYNYE